MIECESMESIAQPAERELTLGIHSHSFSYSCNTALNKNSFRTRNSRLTSLLNLRLYDLLWVSVVSKVPNCPKLWINMCLRGIYLREGHVFSFIFCSIRRKIFFRKIQMQLHNPDGYHRFFSSYYTLSLGKKTKH